MLPLHPYTCDVLHVDAMYAMLLYTRAEFSRLLIHTTQAKVADVKAGRAIQLAPALLCRPRPSIVRPCHPLPADTSLCGAYCLSCFFGGLLFLSGLGRKTSANFVTSPFSLHLLWLGWIRLYPVPELLVAGSLLLLVAAGVWVPAVLLSS